MSLTNRLYIASDHAGTKLKRELQAAIPTLPWVDLGTTDEASVDYPDFADLLCQKILHDSSAQASLGILICGSGIGMSIRANRFKGIRAALVSTVENAKLAREHNDANVICLASRNLAADQAVSIVRAWLEATPPKEERHLRRIRKLDL